MSAPVHWTQIPPEIAVKLPISVLENDIVLPVVEHELGNGGDVCPWPWEPQQLVGAPLGQYHCGYCGSMELAGIPHSDMRQWGRFDQKLGYYVDVWPVEFLDRLHEVYAIAVEEFPPYN